MLFPIAPRLPWLYMNSGLWLYILDDRNKKINEVDRALIVSIIVSMNDFNGSSMDEDTGFPQIKESLEKLRKLGLLFESRINGEKIIRLHPYMAFHAEDLEDMDEFADFKLKPFHQIGFFNYLKKMQKGLKRADLAMERYADDFGGKTLTTMTSWYQETMH